MLEKVKIFACEAHAKVNHLYGVLPYSYHLEMVVDTAMEFIHLIPLEDRTNVICALWLHDTIEDCNLTYNDIVKISNHKVAEIVYALTNEKGKTRKERASAKYYSDMINVEYARFGKLCDRVANVTNSKRSGSRMYAVYLDESSSFVKSLFPNKLWFNTRKNQKNTIVKFINRIVLFFNKQVPVMIYEKSILEKLTNSFDYDSSNFELLIINNEIQNENYGKI
jgi:hypothetical protein